MTYQRADPTDPPMVQVRVDDQWHPGRLIAQELREDGEWDVHVQYRRAPGKRRKRHLYRRRHPPRHHRPLLWPDRSACG